MSVDQTQRVVAESCFLSMCSRRNEVLMSMRFSDVFQQELQLAGHFRAPAASSAASCPVPLSSARPAALPVDTYTLSGRAKGQASSLQEYAKDKERVRNRDSGIVTGREDFGYLWKSAEGGIRGHMRFTTSSGAEVDILAGEQAVPAADVRVTVKKNGSEFSFAIEELGEASRSVMGGPLPALEGNGVAGAEPCDRDDAVLDVPFVYSHTGESLGVVESAARVSGFGDAGCAAFIARV